MYRYHTFGSRFLAAIIDGVLLTIFDMLFNEILKFNFGETIQGSILTNGLFYFYSIFLHYKYGQTLGKKIVNVKVVSNTDETRLTGIGNSIRRDSIGILLVLISIVVKFTEIRETQIGEFLRIYPVLIWSLTEILTTLLNRKRRAIHDFLGNSVVIDIKVYPKPKSDTLSA